MDFNELSHDLQEKVRACKNSEELDALCAAEGIELSDDVLQSLSGGSECPRDGRSGCPHFGDRGPRCQTACGMNF